MSFQIGQKDASLIRWGFAMSFKKGTRKYIEHQLQKGVIDWAKEMIDLGWKKDELITLHSIPNGGERPKKQDKKGRWYCPEGRRLNEEGLKAGMPDLCLPVSRGPYHGLYIEMKAPGYGLSPKQKDVHPQLQCQGYRVVVCEKTQAAVDEIVRYLSADKYVLLRRCN
jgi:hypothetical protein